VVVVEAASKGVDRVLDMLEASGGEKVRNVNEEPKGTEGSWDTVVMEA
jgi:hypothetical protein